MQDDKISAYIPGCKFNNNLRSIWHCLSFYKERVRNMHTISIKVKARVSSEINRLNKQQANIMPHIVEHETDTKQNGG